MSSLNLSDDKRKIFKCPRCSQYISLSICPKCSFKVDDNEKSRLIDACDDEVKHENRKFYKPIIWSGIGSLVVGLLLAGLRLLENDFSPRGAVLAIVGIGTIFYGVRGLYKER